MDEENAKTEFDFGWKTRIEPQTAELALKHNRGSILDIGCGTCKLYDYLRSRGWKGQYTGIDTKRYEGYEYPEGIELIIGDATTITLPKTDTCILYNVLEHVNEPTKLLSKCLGISKNTLVNVPKRNEELWAHGVIEYHQLDKSHRHCGYTKEEIAKVIEKAGGRIVDSVELGKTDATVGMSLWKSSIPRFFVRNLRKIFASKFFYQEMWFEIEKTFQKVE